MFTLANHTSKSFLVIGLFVKQQMRGSNGERVRNMVQNATIPNFKSPQVIACLPVTARNADL